MADGGKGSESKSTFTEWELALTNLRIRNHFAKKNLEGIQKLIVKFFSEGKAELGAKTTSDVDALGVGALL